MIELAGGELIRELDYKSLVEYEGNLISMDELKELFSRDFDFLENILKENDLNERLTIQ